MYWTYNITLRRVRAAIVAVAKQCATYCGSVFVALGIQHAMRMCRIIACGLSGCTTFFSHYLKKGTIFEEEKNSYWTQNVCFDILYNFCMKYFSF